MQSTYEQPAFEQPDMSAPMYTYAPTTPPKKKNKVPGIILLILGALFVLAGIAMFFVGGNSDKLETGEAIDVYFATETDEYAYINVQYMTESIASYAAMDNLQMYMTFDADWNPAIVCVHNDDLAQFQPYIDWMYTDSEEGGPEQMTVTGYAQPYDEQLKGFVIESFAEMFEEGVVDESNFEEWFGEYYLQIGQKNSSYGVSNVGFILLIVAIVMIVVGGVMIYEKPVSEENGPIVRETHTGLGILGALLGALLGGLLWTLIGVLGYVSGWVGILIIIFSYQGYRILSHKEDTFGLVISIIFGLLVILPATYLYYGWDFYCALNESVSGYTTLARALMEMPAYLTEYKEWSSFFGDVAMGYGFMLLVGIFYGVSLISNRKKK